jgi:hypothetical protein
VANITITNIDTGSVVLEKVGEAEGLLKNAVASEVTFLAGTILARDISDGMFYPYADAGLDGLDAAKFVLPYEVTLAASATGTVTVLTAGKVNQSRLVIHDETPITAAHLDMLRDFGITPVVVEQLSQYDNPQ